MVSYLTSEDIASLGLSNATPAQIAQGCAMVDAYLMRPEGLVWAPDWSGAPCYMANKTPAYTIQATAGFGPGQNVVVSVPQSAMLQDKIGAAVVIDRGTPDLTEACTILSLAAGSMTVASVSNAHASGAAIDFGMLIEEERSLPAKRPITRASRAPVARLAAGVGRYGLGRRSDQIAGLYSDANLLAVIQTFGGPPAWVSWDVNQASVSSTTGEIWVPAGLLLAYYSDVRFWYVAGWAVAQIPQAIKQAVANIVNAMIQFPQMTGNVKSLKAGDTQIQRFTDTVLDSDTKTMLNPFKARNYA